MMYFFLILYDSTVLFFLNKISVQLYSEKSTHAISVLYRFDSLWEIDFLQDRYY